MADIRIIGVEAPIIWENPLGNRGTFEAKIRESVVEGIDIVVLPDQR